MFDISNPKQVIEFNEADPYNPQNTLRGYINRRQGALYGSLIITHVNKEPCSQFIYSAPKQHYPFDKNKNWEFPEFDDIELYEKLDGTCIIRYNYKDSDNNIFTTYKTRLRPFLGKSQYGNFFSLWNEMLDTYPQIKNLPDGFNYVFELYGKRNKILIDYDIPLNTKLIFFIDNGYIFPPSELPPQIDIPKLNPILSTDNITKESYLQFQQDLQTILDIDEENHILKGMEGYVIYFLKEGATQIKCKPEAVLKYHWSGDAIPYESIYTTVINSFENFDSPTVDDINQLLAEEYLEDKISKSYNRIQKILDRVTFEKKLQTKLLIDYKEQNLDINKDKRTCMRWFAEHYPKSQSRRIFRLIKQYEKEE